MPKVTQFFTGRFALRLLTLRVTSFTTQPHLLKAEKATLLSSVRLLSVVRQWH